MGAITAGRAHLADEDDSWPTPGDAARRWGWEYVPPVAQGQATWRAQGERVGWVEGDDVYLDTTVLLATVETHLRRTDQTLGVSAETLHKRLFERGRLLSTEHWSGKRRLTVRKTFAGERRSVLHLSGKWLFDPRAEPEPPPPDGSDEAPPEGEGTPEEVRQVRQVRQSPDQGAVPQEEAAQRPPPWRTRLAHRKAPEGQSAPQRCATTGPCPRRTGTPLAHLAHRFRHTPPLPR